MAFDLSIEPRFPPREPRKSIRLASTVLLPDDREVAVVLTNVSRSGFTAYIEVPIEPAITLGVALPGSGIRRAEVRWCEGGEFGGRFKDRLSEAQVSAI